MFYLEQQHIIDSFAHNIWRIATPPTAMDEDELPAEPATKISRLALFYFFVINNFFTYQKSNKNAMSVKKKRAF